MTVITTRAKLLWQRALNTTSFSAHVLLTIGTNLAIASIGLLTGSLSARILGPEGRGELAAIQTWPYFFAWMALWGLPEAITYFSAQNPRRAGQYMTSAMGLAFVLAIPVFVLGYSLMPVLLAAQSQEVLTAARWYLLSIFVQILLVMQTVPLRGKKDLLVWNLLRPTPNLMWLVVLVSAVLLRNSSAQYLALVYLISLSLLFLPRQIVVMRRLSPPLWPPLPQLWKPMLRYGLPLVASGLPTALNLRLDQMLMTALLSPKTLGYYVVAVAWSAALAPIVRAIGIVIFPHTAAQVSSSQQNAVLTRGVRLASLSSIGLSLPVLLLTPIAIPALFGADFTPAIAPAMILVVASGVLNLGQVLQEGSRGLGQTRVVFWSECVGLVMTLVTLMMLLKPFGITGAALASLFAYTATTVFLIWRTTRMTNCPLSTLLLPQRADLIAIKNRITTLAKSVEKY
jgi:antigen flippase